MSAFSLTWDKSYAVDTGLLRGGLSLSLPSAYVDFIHRHTRVVTSSKTLNNCLEKIIICSTVIFCCYPGVDGLRWLFKVD